MKSGYILTSQSRSHKCMVGQFASNSCRIELT